MLQVCIKQETTVAGFNSIKAKVLDDMRRLSTSKSHKRLLITLIDCCHQSDLDDIAAAICGKSKTLAKLVDDKYLVYAVIGLVNRGNMYILNTLNECLGSRVNKLMNAKYSKFLLYKLLDYNV